MKKLWIAFAAGAILGILYAPASGRRTRKRIAGIGDNAKRKWNSITDSVADRIESIREGVDDMADRAVDKVEGTQFDTV